ncbi:MAG: ATP-grasp domain-containing protein [Ilumatobacteraceae bacterium]
MIGLVTATTIESLDTDLPLLVDAFERAGQPVRTLAWDDPTVDWTELDLAVLRSTWDYPHRHDEFLDWVERVASATRLWNPPPAVRWNIDKGYLAALGGDGVPVVPTTFVPPGSSVEESGLVADPEAAFVVKPSVAAGALGAGRHRGVDVAARVAELHAEGRTAMVQPYLDGIDRGGETVLVYIGDGESLRFSHAVSKGAILAREIELEGGLVAVEQIDDHRPTDAERAVGDAVLATPAVRRLGPLAYARVDLAPTSSGPVVLELELIEPSLHLGRAPGAADQAVACWGRLETGR